jgi:hypothetical protein
MTTISPPAPAWYSPSAAIAYGTYATCGREQLTGRRSDFIVHVTRCEAIDGLPTQTPRSDDIYLGPVSTFCDLIQQTTHREQYQPATAVHAEDWRVRDAVTTPSTRPEATPFLAAPYGVPMDAITLLQIVYSWEVSPAGDQWRSTITTLRQLAARATESAPFCTFIFIHPEKAIGTAYLPRMATMRSIQRDYPTANIVPAGWQDTDAQAIDVVGGVVVETGRHALVGTGIDLRPVITSTELLPAGAIIFCHADDGLLRYEIYPEDHAAFPENACIILTANTQLSYVIPFADARRQLYPTEAERAETERRSEERARRVPIDITNRARPLLSIAAAQRNVSARPPQSNTLVDTTVRQHGELNWSSTVWGVPVPNFTAVDVHNVAPVDLTDREVWNAMIYCLRYRVALCDHYGTVARLGVNPLEWLFTRPLFRAIFTEWYRRELQLPAEFVKDVEDMLQHQPELVAGLRRYTSRTAPWGTGIANTAALREAAAAHPNRRLRRFSGDT